MFYNIAFDISGLHEDFIKCGCLSVSSGIYIKLHICISKLLVIGGLFCQGNILKPEITNDIA